MANEIKDIVTGFREVIQDLLVPELKAIKKELEYQNKEFKLLDLERRVSRLELLGGKSLIKEEIAA